MVFAIDPYVSTWTAKVLPQELALSPLFIAGNTYTLENLLMN